MALDTDEIRGFGFGHIYSAPVGTAEPADITEAVNTANWTEHGHITDAGPRFSFGKARRTETSWQSFPNPDRTYQDAEVSSVSFDMKQWNADNVALLFGGGEVTEDGPDAYTYEPPERGDLDERAVIVELQDGDFEYRFIFRRTENQAPADFAAVANGSSPLPVRSVLLDSSSLGEGVRPWIVQTNDPAFVPAGS